MKNITDKTIARIKDLLYHYRMEKPVLAIIVPCYNDEEIVNKTYNELSKIINDLKFSDKISKKSYLSFIDDGSTDSTWSIIKDLDVKGIKLSKNFGHQKALMAGLCENKADIYISIDVDLQDDINTIEKMIDKYHEGFEIVYGVRNNRDVDKFFKKIFSNLYYILNNLLGMNTISQHADFRLISDKIAEQLRNLKETNIYLRGIIANLGFKSTKIYYKRLNRIGGKSKYNIYKLVKLAVEGITSFSEAPLKFISLLGLLCFFIAVIMTIYALYVFITDKVIIGWTSLFVSLYFIGGIQLLSIGILGEYIGKIYKETKQRPTYIIEEKTNV